MTTARDRAGRRDDGPENEKGEVSEVSGMDPQESDTPISPEDATAGYPESESGHPDEGEAGPDAVPPANSRRRRA